MSRARSTAWATIVIAGGIVAANAFRQPSPKALPEQPTVGPAQQAASELTIPLQLRPEPISATPPHARSDERPIPGRSVADSPRVATSTPAPLAKPQAGSTDLRPASRPLLPDRLAASIPIPSIAKQPPSAAAMAPPAIPTTRLQPHRERLSTSSVPEKRHRIKDGDSLPSLAQRYLGDEERWPEIYQANREKISHPDLLVVGEELVIPIHPAPMEEANRLGLDFHQSVNGIESPENLANESLSGQPAASSVPSNGVDQTFPAKLSPVPADAFRRFRGN
ncbi:MAG: LysM peptidoglycan-binding domain-containing protein [Planctomycetales bacterium]|nr:LysM peptidoglycan-binding domain-containing protein [Planctomycetales bacterium]